MAGLKTKKGRLKTMKSSFQTAFRFQLNLKSLRLYQIRFANSSALPM